MNANDVFPSRFLKADDVDGELTVTILGIELETLKNRDRKDEQKAVCKFAEAGVKPLILNKTNWGIIAGLYGKDSDDWERQRITLYTTDVEAFGEKVRAVRVRDRKPVAARPAPAKMPAVQTLAVDGPPQPDDPPDDWI